MDMSDRVRTGEEISRECETQGWGAVLPGASRIELENARARCIVGASVAAAVAQALESGTASREEVDAAWACADQHDQLREHIEDELDRGTA